MKKIILIISLILIACKPEQANPPVLDISYKQISEKFVMPDTVFSMKLYYMGFLKRGPKWAYKKTDELTKLSEGHMNNINRLANLNKLIIAGPFDHPDTAPEHGTLAGIFIFECDSLKEAELLMSTDPAIAAGMFTMEILPWYGAAGLTYNGRKKIK